METKERNVGEYARPEGVEVKVSTGRITGIIFLSMFILVIVSALLYNYIWGEVSSYRSEYELGHAVRFEAFTLRGGMNMILCLLGYILLQYIALYCFSGRNFRALRWNMDWKSWGFLLTKPLALKYYRIALLLPFFVLGLFPMIHGFCTGNSMIYFIGIYCVLCSSGDCYYFWKLRSFNDNDKIIDGNESFSATIIKGTY
ncbi:DUF3267 domain-containing protein [Parabacteroides hominis]|uniref:DUF3267 domain-containing protein n=1 Tax=Parabacteroides hominis TaxID=2763057 RepID=A0ABR7DNQ4_9BACT|nr:DUF3267 domain-containing protein [Parabacteroides hominis]MBC5632433.1 DUF3267 domain-containing protein [Parabacteroides hominis]